jgi:hypothetical protein
VDFIYGMDLNTVVPSQHVATLLLTLSLEKKDNDVGLLPNSRVPRIFVMGSGLPGMLQAALPSSYLEIPPENRGVYRRGKRTILAS